MMSEKVLGNINVEKIKEWFSQKEKKILVYHRDADGVCSAALFMKFFKDFSRIPREGPVIDDNFFKKLLDKEPKLLVFVDIPVDQEYKKIEKLMEKLPELKISIIDHHLPEKNMNSEKLIHVNPMFNGNYYVPASCVLYKLFKLMNFDVEKYIWITAMGMIGDYAIKDCAWVLEENEKLKGPKHCELVKATEMIASSITLKGAEGAEKVLKLLMKSDNFEEFKNSKELKRWNEIVQKEVKRLLNDFDRNKEFISEKNIIFYEIKSKMNIASIIATATAEKYPNNLIIIRKKAGDHWKISLRYQKGDISVGDLAKNASKGIGSGGGHVKSAGALVNNWEEFRRRLLEMI